MAGYKQSGREAGEALRKMVDRQIAQHLQEAPFNQTKWGIVKSKNANAEYSVMIQKNTYNGIKAIVWDNEIKVGDVVTLNIPNGEMGNAYIVGKYNTKPEMDMVTIDDITWQIQEIAENYVLMYTETYLLPYSSGTSNKKYTIKLPITMANNNYAVMATPYISDKESWKVYNYNVAILAQETTMFDIATYPLMNSEFQSRVRVIVIGKKL